MPLLKSFVGPQNNLTEDEWNLLVKETENLNIIGLRCFVQKAKDRIEGKISAATHFFEWETSSGKKWIPCDAEYPLGVRREHIHFSTVFCPSIILTDFFDNPPKSSKSKSRNFFSSLFGRSNKPSYRKMFRLTQADLDKMNGTKSNIKQIYSESIYKNFMEVHVNTCYS